MLGHLDVDAHDDTWSLKMNDGELASGGRYDRISFTVSEGKLSGLVNENVMDLAGPHAAPYPLAAFEGSITAEQLHKMTHDPALLGAETAFLERAFGEQMALGVDSSSSTVESSSFNDSLRDHALEFTGVFLASAFVGMASVLGAMRFMSPSKPAHSYTTVMDESAQPRAEVELEKPYKKLSPDLML
jgi:hypothetical protein